MARDGTREANVRSDNSEFICHSFSFHEPSDASYHNNSRAAPGDGHPTKYDQLCKCINSQLDAGRFSGEDGALVRCLRELKKLLMYVCRRIVGP
jgi:hypothetical protein